ncbi:MAG: type III-B CRISPR-associated protein Cas10/Cmr2 [Desulfovibrio sp. S3730MH75]|nr:MAG: type III-B CRISPR-associated protein Cas10/Cmr2 [Desulfovibrio sp. S3730MH75]
MGTLLLISLGPVQDFIASARKLRDLWSGSYMLSEFSKTVARTLERNGAELIFPAPENSNELEKETPLIVANKILAIVASPEEAERLQNVAKGAWKEHFDSFGQTTSSFIERRFKHISINKELFDSEMKDYGEFFAVWTPINNFESYQDARARVESMLASRKNLRAFKAPEWEGAGIPKNSLDGMRECVLKKAPEITGLLKKNEKLDAIGCIKRFNFSDGAIDKRHFSDLAEMSLVPWLNGAEDDYAKVDLINAFQDAIAPDSTAVGSKRQVSTTIPLKIGAENFFCESSDFEKMYKDQARGIWNYRKQMVKVCGEPPLYSVIMVGDGDHMGKMIDAIPDKDAHKLFSRKLSEFSKRVTHIIDKAGGSVIYAGGDDVMAYLPLHTAVACADEMRLTFYEEMETLCDLLGPDSITVPTFSVGMAVVHYKHPLDRALDLARKAESIAKNLGGRNSMALIQSKRSGSDVTVYGKWDAEGELLGIAERINRICNLYNKDEQVLPSKLGYDLRRVLIETGGSSAMSFSVDGGVLRPVNATAALVKLVFDHKNDGNAAKNEQLRALLEGRTDVAQLADELVIVRLIAQANKLAKGAQSK